MCSAVPPCTSLCSIRAKRTTDMSCEQQSLRQEPLARNVRWQQSHPCIGQAAVMPGAMNMNMMADSRTVSNSYAGTNTGNLQCPAAGTCCGASHIGPCPMPPPALSSGGTWPAPAMLLNAGVWQLPPGMVWGMPIWNVAVAPGITQTPHASCTPATAAPQLPPPHAPAAVCGSMVIPQGTPCSQVATETHLVKAQAACQYPLPALPLPAPSAAGFWPMTNSCWPMAPV